MFLCFLTLSAAAGLSLAAGDKALKAEWKAFKLEYGKKYKSEAEEEERFKIFAASTSFIREHNEKFAKGLVSYELGMNEFGDNSQEEWMFSLKCVDDDIMEVEGLSTYQPTKELDMKNLPDEVDWRRHGYVTNVKNQKHCGSCWAFSATGALEGQQFKKTGKLNSLSEQNLVDCSKNFGNKGCGGGTPLKAFRYIIANGGIDTEDSYPYEAQDNTCRFKKEKVGVTVKDVLKFPDSEKELQTAVAAFGPVSVGIDANSTEFKYYKDGVFDYPECSRKANHAVLVVGYGIQDGKNIG